MRLRADLRRKPPEEATIIALTGVGLFGPLAVEVPTGGGQINLAALSGVDFATGWHVGRRRRSSTSIRVAFGSCPSSKPS
jgi:hypothetical protein